MALPTWQSYFEFDSALMHRCMDLNRQAVCSTLLLGGAWAVGQAIVFSVGGHKNSAIGALLLCGLLISAHTMVFKKRMALKWEVGVLMIVHLVALALTWFMVLQLEDQVSRRVAQAVAIVVMKLPPSLFGFPLHLAVPMLLASGAADAATFVLARALFDDPGDVRMYALSVIMLIGFTMQTFFTFGRLHGFFKAHEVLSAEQALTESVVAMMCDATVWLSESGYRITRTDERFSAHVGEQALDKSLCTYLADGERARLESCLADAKTAPARLPTTLLAGSGDRIPVDMFIVGKRNPSVAGSTRDATLAYLVGIRTTRRQSDSSPEGRDAIAVQQPHSPLGHGHLPARNGGFGDEHSFMPLAHSHAQNSNPLEDSVPTTTATGNIFERVDIDRLTGDEGDELGQLRGSLERLGALGLCERWLIPSAELTVAAEVPVLGAGSYGVVFAGWLRGSPVAIKATKPSAGRGRVGHLVNVANEIRILRHIRHPSIVLFHGACVESTSGDLLLVLERLKGPDFLEYVKRHSADVEVYSRFQLLLDVACALRYLHAQLPRITHGDLKGSNILIEPAVPRAKLVDFGLSRLLTKGAQPLGGTLAWVAPEVVRDRGTRPNPSADVFSFGRVACMAVTCQKPYEGMKKPQVADKLMAGIPPVFDWQDSKPLHRECLKMCDRVLHLVPEQRPGMEQVHKEVSAWTLPDMEENMPALELSRAAGEDAAGPLGGAGPGGRAASLHEVLTASLARQEQAEHKQRTREASPGANGRHGTVAFRRGAMMLPSAVAMTKEGTKRALLEDAAKRWNFRVQSGCCCQYHAALAEVQRVGRDMMRGDCRSLTRRDIFQCTVCGVLEEERPQRSCAFCSRITAHGDRGDLGNLGDGGAGPGPRHFGL